MTNGWHEMQQSRTEKRNAAKNRAKKKSVPVGTKKKSKSQNNSEADRRS